MTKIKHTTKHILNIIISLVLLTASSMVTAKIYRWTEPDGSLNYSDIPPKEVDKAQMLDIESTSNNKEGPKKPLIQKTNQYDTKVKEKLEEYQTIKEHNSDEDVSPMLKKLKSEKPEGSNSTLPALDQGAKLMDKNCTIAKSNLQALEISKIILDKNKKLHKLTNTEHQQRMTQTLSQIEDYCWSKSMRS